MMKGEQEVKGYAYIQQTTWRQIEECEKWCDKEKENEDLLNVKWPSQYYINVHNMTYW